MSPDASGKDGDDERRSRLSRRLNLLEPGGPLRCSLFRDLVDERFGLGELAPGQRVGVFRVAAEIGRGGMGIVYRAARADGEYEQQVALKWLPDTRPDEARMGLFRHERQILANLKHPNIARLIDGGHCDGGHPWFAMELVEGLPIDQHAVARGLNLTARIHLLLPVLDAVKFAHGKLLVHRDIKPGNVLVDADGQPRLLDFGIAALMDGSRSATAFSPGFASPEQLAGQEVGIASDIWQLGRLCDTVIRAGNAAVSAPDLLAVLARASAEEPEQRYATVAEFDADLRRFLGAYPVVARRASVRHRCLLWARRHPLALGTAAAIAVVFFGTVGAFTYQLAGERDRAELARREAERARAVTQAVNDFITKDILSAADPWAGGKNGVALTTVVEEAVDKVPRRFAGHPEIAGQVNFELGRILSNLGRQDKARTTLDSAIEQLAQAASPPSPALLEARFQRARIAMRTARNSDAGMMFRALRDEAQAQDNQPLLHHIDTELGWNESQLGDFRACHQRFTDLQTAVSEADGPLVRVKITHGRAYCSLRLGQADEAVEQARQGLAFATERLGADHPLTIDMRWMLGMAHLGGGDYDTALPIVEEAHEKARRVRGEDHAGTATIAQNVGIAHLCAGRTVPARHWLERAVTLRRRQFGPDHLWVAATQAVLGIAWLREGNGIEADRLISDATRSLSRDGDEHRYVRAQLLATRAELRLYQRRLADAAQDYRAALEIATDMYGPDNRIKLSPLRVGLGLSLTAQSGHATEGLALLRDALPIAQAHPDCQEPVIRQAVVTLGAH
ncbi:serine/threonine-protein kinase [Tahibacter amnicola]|uniref:Serine/threonine-protein kinase n=1 Tax=Tahibacter amnicola TaxID=2976241 RepID=A0ABY6BKZ9_9GAMM|nr:serine/threonine-protein kinase [Tahibacter amnicola]UXI70457.1 serine/threonine-protein kinase [Tahibacter amnicola]